jgi:hypothetical protein
MGEENDWYSASINYVRLYLPRFISGFTRASMVGDVPVNIEISMMTSSISRYVGSVF